MRATFAAGTVSGALKICVTQIISELEGTTRGPYAGCVGYFSFNGNLDMSALTPALSHRLARENLTAPRCIFPRNPHPACGHPLPLPRARDCGAGGDVCEGN
jgi:hypothetical protein